MRTRTIDTTYRRVFAFIRTRILKTLTRRAAESKPRRGPLRPRADGGINVNSIFFFRRVVMQKRFKSYSNLCGPYI